ncbi:MAG: MarR family winged helix-turn-helix transcriptional regulator [Parvularcula sp.]|jgi:DNA-binding MarR family transcriptional regulator|nr:MarR family winged helix-turn-helix transcriptional regulator [Parvularcula sp.]
MTHDQRTLGTRLRHLIDLLDGGVAEVEADHGRDYRGRYTPVIKALMDGDGKTIGEIAAMAGITHSAASQTVARMVKAGFLEASPGADARQRTIRLTPKAQEILPSLQRRWAATNRAALALEEEIGLPLAQAISAAISALEERSFGERIRAAALEVGPNQNTNDQKVTP